MKNLVSLGVVLSVLAAPVIAETIKIPLGQQGKAWNVQTPDTGLSKEYVEANFGSPMSKSGPVGDPPIYTWEYEKFDVYFESNHVIHSVVKKQPK